MAEIAALRSANVCIIELPIAPRAAILFPDVAQIEFPHPKAPEHFRMVTWKGRGRVATDEEARRQVRFQIGQKRQWGALPCRTVISPTE